MKYTNKIPLLPAHQIQEGYDSAHELVNKLFENDEVNKKRWRNYLNGYFHLQWMKRTKPEVLSVFGEPDRTNNYSETNNNIIGRMLRVKPTTYPFVSKCCF